jgi:hypothetical protein
MVFIHGGSFLTGDGNPSTYGAERFLDHGIVTLFVLKKIKEKNLV